MFAGVECVRMRANVFSAEGRLVEYSRGVRRAHGHKTTKGEQMDTVARTISRRPLGGGKYEVTERRRTHAGAVMRLAMPAMQQRFLPRVTVQRYVGGRWRQVRVVSEFNWYYCASSKCYRNRTGGKGVPLASVLRYVAKAQPSLRDFEIDPATGDGYYTSTCVEDYAVLAQWFSV